MTWGQPAAASSVFLVHGFMDAAGTWDRVAPLLAAAGHHVIAPDMRGFGDGARAPSGAYYHFPDYVADVDALTRELVPDGAPLSLVGHSMGGTVVTLYAGAHPERVRRLVSIEGLGPPDNGFDMGPIRMRRWLDDLAAVRPAAPIPRADARRRFGVAHPHVPAEVLDHRFPHLVHDAGDGTVTWRYDPLHRTTSPMPFFAPLFKEYARRVTCPVTFVSGGPRGFHPPDEADRLAAFAQCETVTLEDAGHMVHWTKPDELARILVSRLGQGE
ncbi:MAG: alpha/beta hydrolase [Labilithrix sp.]|nr:alpha/beta hydrolase [Labilithrix sp.]MCW5815686.1 alpha/beta hydrolase [Labilithrix sp.]